MFELIGLIIFLPILFVVGLFISLPLRSLLNLQYEKLNIYNSNNAIKVKSAFYLGLKDFGVGFIFLIFAPSIIWEACACEPFRDVGIAPYYFIGLMFLPIISIVDLLLKYKRLKQT